MAGLGFAGVGLTAVVLSLVLGSTNTTSLRTADRVAIGVVIGVPFFSVGVGIAGGRPLWQWVVRVMPWVGRVPWGHLLGGGSALALGIGFVCLGIFSSDTSNMPEGRGPVIFAGLAFALAGAAVLLPLLSRAVSFFPERAVYWVGTAIAGGLLLCFAAVPAMLAFSSFKRGKVEVAPILSVATIIALIAVTTYVAIRDRRRKSSKQEEQSCGDADPGTSLPEEHDG